jgi:hypothetical protein
MLLHRRLPESRDLSRSRSVVFTNNRQRYFTRSRLCAVGCHHESSFNIQLVGECTFLQQSGSPSASPPLLQ